VSERVRGLQLKRRHVLHRRSLLLLCPLLLQWVEQRERADRRGMGCVDRLVVKGVLRGRCVYGWCVGVSGLRGFGVAHCLWTQSSALLGLCRGGALYWPAIGDWPGGVCASGDANRCSLVGTGSGGKWVHHRCGARLWAIVIGRLDGMVVVNYRDGSPTGLVVSLCPGCGVPLQLWWVHLGSVDQGRVLAAEVERVLQMEEG
jgi:hypothetical protein